MQKEEDYIMSQTPSIKKNVAFKLAYQVLAILVPLVTAPYVSRVLGADGIGIYSYTHSYMTYFTMFAALGTVSYGTRQIAQVRDDSQKLSKTFWEIEIMTLMTTAIALVVWVCIVFISEDYGIYFACLIPTLLATGADISWLYTGTERIHYSVIWNAVSKILGLLLVFTLIKSKDDLVLYVFMMSFILFVGNISMWIFLPKVVTRINIKDLNVLPHFKQTLKYFITSVAISLYTVLDKTMIGVITHDEFQNGYYEQAEKIINLIRPFAFTAINDATSPRMSYLFANEKYDEIKEKMRYSLNIELFISIGCCFGIIAVADTFVPVFMGNGYEPVINILRVMSFILIPICLSTCTGTHYYVPSGNVLKGTKLTLIGAIVNLIINIPLIFRFKAMGAVLASLVAEIIIGVLYVYKCRDYVNLRVIMQISWKKIIAGIIMASAVYFLGSISYVPSLYRLVLQITSGVGIYIIVLVVLRDNVIDLRRNIMRE